MWLRKLILILLVLIPASLFASKHDGQTITFSALFDAMVHHAPEGSITFPTKKSAINFHNLKIVFDRKTDDFLDQRFSESGEEIIIPYDLNFYNCSFDVEFWWLLRNLRFQGYVSFFNCEKIKAIFKECTFEKTVRMYSSEIEFMHYDGCTFEHGYKQGRTAIEDYLSFTDCAFSVNPKYVNDSKAFDMEARLFFLANRGDGIDLRMERCVFQLPESLKANPNLIVDISASNFTNLKFSFNKVGVPIKFSESSIDNQFETIGCQFDTLLFAEAFNFNPQNARIEWSSIQNNRLAIFNKENQRVITGASAGALSEELAFNQLVSCYANFYNAFKSQGNRFGANACYIEWKDIETIYLKHQLKERYSFQTYFNYLMNIFLKTFCDYGTNPIKAIEWSLYVMMSFGLIYFVFPGSTDYFNDGGVFKSIHKMMGYFTSGKSISELFHSKIEKNAEHPSIHFQNFKQDINANRDKVPSLIRMFVLPMFYIGRAYDWVNDAWFSLLDRISGRWENMNPKRKFWAAILYVLVFLITLISYFLFRMMNALMLSLNAFSTLGFGEVPVKGLARYLTVIEGFVGWFLLSIFSVALISQILQ
jgi:hypothetical protein